MFCDSEEIMKKKYLVFVVIIAILLAGVTFGAAGLGIMAAYTTGCGSIGDEISGDMTLECAIPLLIVLGIGSIPMVIAYAKFYFLCVVAEANKVFGNYRKEKMYTHMAEEMWSKIND